MFHCFDSAHFNLPKSIDINIIYTVYIQVINVKTYNSKAIKLNNCIKRRVLKFIKINNLHPYSVNAKYSNFQIQCKVTECHLLSSRFFLLLNIIVLPPLKMNLLQLRSKHKEPNNMIVTTTRHQEHRPCEEFSSCFASLFSSEELTLSGT